MKLINLLKIIQKKEIKRNKKEAFFSNRSLLALNEAEYDVIDYLKEARALGIKRSVLIKNAIMFIEKHF